MVDTERQVPAPSAAAWSIDLSSVGGPTFVVMRVHPDDAREALAQHLIDIGSVDEAAGRELIKAMAVESVQVIW